MKVGYEGLIFSKRLGLIAWLRESMSRKKSDQLKCFFSENGGKSLHFFLIMFDTKERPV